MFVFLVLSLTPSLPLPSTGGGRPRAGQPSYDGAAEVKRSRAGRNRCGEDKDGAAEGGEAVRVAEGGTMRGGKGGECCSFSKSKSHTSLFSVDKKGWWPAAGGDVAASLLYVTPQRPLLWTRRVLGRDGVATGPPWT